MFYSVALCSTSATFWIQIRIIQRLCSSSEVVSLYHNELSIRHKRKERDEDVRTYKKILNSGKKGTNYIPRVKSPRQFLIFRSQQIISPWEHLLEYPMNAYLKYISINGPASSVCMYRMYVRMLRTTK